MSLLIFQITIKQWDKGENTLSHQSARAAIPSVYSINSKPAFKVFDKPCILEQHGDDIPTNIFNDGRIQTSILSNERVMFDRFQIVKDSKGFLLEYLVKGKSAQTLGLLNQGWIQSRYTWRYSVIEAKQLYWMYEDVTLNAVYMEEFDANCFLKAQPSIVFNDL
jgi:hypothetical protein